MSRSVIRVVLVRPGLRRAGAAPAAAADATLFRLFLTDGSSLASYGEFARLDDHVIFSMPAGGPAERRGCTSTLSASSSTGRARTLRPVGALPALRGHCAARHDFQRLSNEVAGVLNNIALTTDRPRALAIAQRARRTLADWPRPTTDIVEADVREISGSSTKPSPVCGRVGQAAFELSLVATSRRRDARAGGTMPSAREQLDQLFRIAGADDAQRSGWRSSSRRCAAGRSGRRAVVEPAGSSVPSSIRALRRSIERACGASGRSTRVRELSRG